MEPPASQEEAVPEMIRVETSNTPSPDSSATTGNLNILNSEKLFESIWCTNMSHKQLQMLQKERDHDQMIKVAQTPKIQSTDPFHEEP